ncbi:hypothetical protein RB653_006146 [Dictyostelium firmibasis]|uniref:Uncharacterized protein n=1 Tax=Dictyostelium firmibasis TaxID=79012 RepID=A0AAN7U2A3_9MYCE
MSSAASSKSLGKKYKHGPNKKTKFARVAPKHVYTPTGIDDARVNLFFKTARGLEQEELNQLLSQSWEVSPLDTLKLVFQLRDCRGGKGERNLFQQSLVWMNQVSPSTVEKNFKHVPEFGSWKDVVQLIGTNVEPLALESITTQLKKDSETLLKDQEKAKISLAAKWAPTEGHSDPTSSKACKKIALLLSTNKSTAKKDYRKNYLVPLRKHLDVVERKMSANQWNEINYSKVPSRCMKLQRKAFERHEPTLFAEYVESLKKGETKINAKQLFPHEVIREYLKGVAKDDILEEQWKVLEQEVRKLGSLKDCLSLVDVSGSMSGQPMEVSIALGILISSVTAPPFKDLVITFHETPTFHKIIGDSLHDKVKNLSSAPWGCSTNFNRAFQMILEKAIENKLPQADMPKKLFVISDMAFDSADGSYSNKGNHEAMLDQYKDAGYEPPQMIYWNVNGASGCTPVGDGNAKGVGLISGFSPSILKAVIETGEMSNITPKDLMEAAINDKRYSDLVV